MLEHPVPTTHLSARQYCHKLERRYVLRAVSSIRVIRKEYMQMDQYLRSSSSSHFDLRAETRARGPNVYTLQRVYLFLPKWKLLK